MADTKLSALPELNATPADDDEVYIRDVSEAAAAESKRITIANLMAAGYTDADALAAAVQSGVITNGVTKAPTHDAVFDVKATADAAQTAAEVASSITTHNNNTTTAHGAVSAATASKHVVRDASARAKFAAPGAAGDALIKGTPLTITELPALTTDKIWLGVAGRPVISDLPAGGPTIATGSYTANDTDDRQITTGFKCSMVVLLTSSITTAGSIIIMVPSLSKNALGTNDTTDNILHGSDGFIVSTDTLYGNYSTREFYYWAISE